MTNDRSPELCLENREIIYLALLSGTLYVFVDLFHSVNCFFEEMIRELIEVIQLFCQGKQLPAH